MPVDLQLISNEANSSNTFSVKLNNTISKEQTMSISSIDVNVFNHLSFNNTESRGILPLLGLTTGALVLGLKASFIAALFVGARALLPRYKYSDLINLCWLGLLPLIFSLTLMFPALLSQDFILFELMSGWGKIVAPSYELLTDDSIISMISD